MRITTAQLKAKRAGKPLPRKEGEIQAAILAYLRTVPGVVAWRQNSGAVKDGARFVRFGFKGLSDIAGWRAGCVTMHADTNRTGGPQCPFNNPQRGYHAWRATPLYVECKAPGKQPTREQAAFLQAVTDAGGLAIVAHSVDDVVSALGLAKRGSAAVAAP